MPPLDSLHTKTSIKVGTESVDIFSLKALEAEFPTAARLPYSLKILLENLLRREDGRHVTADDLRALAGWNAAAPTQKEIAFMPARVLLQDFTGVPAVVDLAAMRDGMVRLGGDPARVNPLQPVELVIDHSVQVDYFARPDAFQLNAELEFRRNRERYTFLRWGQDAFDNFKVVPPDTGIVHQVNLEYLARVVFREVVDGVAIAYPDTLVGTDSHTTMINGLGVVGWGVGGIEAEAAMLGQPISMLIPDVIGFRLTGDLPEGATATDLVLTITERLRKHGVVGKFVEFFGEGLASLTIADRATLGNMCPEYGATVAIFPIDEMTLDYLRLTGREKGRIQLVETYARAQGLFRVSGAPEAVYTQTIELDLTTVEPSLAGPKRPQDRVSLKQAKARFQQALPAMIAESKKAAPTSGVQRLESEGGQTQPAGARGGVAVLESPPPAAAEIDHGFVVVAAITSCTNTSNPSVMIGAGVLAKKAVDAGLRSRPWVKTSLAPGSKVVTEYLEKSGLQEYLNQLGFSLVGYGCTTCIGNSGPLPDDVSRAVKDRNLVVASVLSGNRNFEGRIQSQVRANYLTSPPLVVAYALAGRMTIDLTSEPLGQGTGGKDIYLRDLWPSEREIQETMLKAVRPEMFAKVYGEVFEGDERWKSLSVPKGHLYEWDRDSTYIRKPPFFEDLTREPAAIADIVGARALCLLGDSVTTDHLSPAGSIPADTPAGRYLVAHGVPPSEFNSYGARRGNHEVMMRGTFASIRLKNKMVPGVEGGWTVHLPQGEQTTIYDAAIKYQAEGVPLLVIAGKEYGSGSSRDWAAKGTRLLGVRAVIAEGFERIHRSNLVNMGVLPLQFRDGEGAEGLKLTGRERYDLPGLAAALAPGARVVVRVTSDDGSTREITTVARIDTPEELAAYRHGGILPYVLRQLTTSS
ncbi:MAG: aconitate hydratase AcnA [Acidobacteria bacterium]|nr:aconitate hydratase AcnA [Acidobacteriota bacterium]